MFQTYNNEEVQQILREATMMSKDDDISPEQLQEIASEVGISAQTLEKAKKIWLERQKASQEQAKKRDEFIRFNLIPYLTISIFLVFLNLVTTPRDFWSIYPVLGWGLGVAIEGMKGSQSKSCLH